MSNKILQIDGLRTIGMLMILTFHYGYRFFEIYGGPLFEPIKYWGNMGCVLFFLISSFFIYKKDEEHELCLKDELKKRTNKLWTPYVISISITFIFLSIYPLEGRNVGIIEYICNIFMINGFIGVDYVDGAHWYLTYLVAFNVVACILKKNKLSKNDAVYWLWLILNILVLLSANFFGQVIGKILSVLRIFLGGNYAGVLISGIVLKRMIDDRTCSISKMLLLFSCVVFTALLQNYSIGLFFVGCLIVLFYVYRGKIRMLKNPLFSCIGAMSYYIYLLHQNIGYSILKKLMCWGGLEYYYIYVLIVLIVIIGLSVLLKRACFYINTVMQITNVKPNI